MHTTASAASSTSESAAAPHAAPELDTEGPWSAEPQTSEDLDARHDTLHTFPGRNANTVLKIVPAVQKGETEAKLVAENQQYKLFMVPG